MIRHLLLFTALLGTLFLPHYSYSQTNETPQANYRWKKNKTELQRGYVVLRSGKKLEGMIRLEGAPGNLESVYYEGDGKEIDFPAGALHAYGLDASEGMAAKTPAGATPGSKSSTPDSYYDWTETGVVMNKPTFSSAFAPGYARLNSGTTLKGELSARKVGEEVKRLVIKTAGGKEKLKIEDVAEYGLDISAADVEQREIGKGFANSFAGSITTAGGEEQGQLTLKGETGANGYPTVIFKNAAGVLRELSAAELRSCTLMIKGERVQYISHQGYMVRLGYEGKAFRYYINPKPTHINQSAMDLAGGAATVGTQAISQAIVNSEEKKGGYETNLDSVIANSTTEELITLRDGFVKAGGYSSYDEAIERSDNETYKNNLSAVELALQGRQAASSVPPIYYVEWILENKSTGERTVVYKKNFKEESEALLYGCYQYLELPKSEQNRLTRWKNRDETIPYLDRCYGE